MTWPRPELNRNLTLRPEADAAGRRVFEIIETHDVRWLQCPRCRARFWYAILSDTPREERWTWGTRLRERLLAASCGEHRAASVMAEPAGDSPEQQGDTPGERAEPRQGDG
ncbi:MAG: hypothetical protein IT305_01875 [Chloroflexi bacterium]|nr:hypothetical protein [Chloroflexota bacterium]